MFPLKYKYDVFISHAVEDKLPIANELCKRLEESGLRVWYSGFNLAAGDSIEGKIRNDLPKSRYAVVILSPHYLSKAWTMKEYYMLQAQEKAGRKVILPVLYDITADDLRGDLYMADKFAIPYSKGMDFVLGKLLEVLKPPPVGKKSLVKRGTIAAGILAIILAASYFLYGIMKPSVPDQSFVEHKIEERITNYQTTIENDLKLKIADLKGRSAQHSEIVSEFAKFANLKTYYRNEYEFSNGFKELRSKKNVEHELRINLDDLTPVTIYGFTAYKSFLTPLRLDGLVNTFAFAFVNDKPLTYVISNTKILENGDYQVTVNYSNNIRSVLVNLIFPAGSTPKRYQVSMKGFLPAENYVFRQQEGVWTLDALH